MKSFGKVWRDEWYNVAPHTGGTDTAKMADTGLASPDTATQSVEPTVYPTQKEIASTGEAVEHFTKDLSPALATTIREMYNETEVSTGEKTSSDRPTGGMSYRAYKSSGPMSAFGTAMFADAPALLEGNYGDTLYTVDHSDLVDIESLVPEIASALQADYDAGVLAPSLEMLVEQYGADGVAREFNPEDIVDSAGAWDNDDTVTWFAERFLQGGDGPMGVKTQDGAVVFDESLIRNEGEKGEALSRLGAKRNGGTGHGEIQRREEAGGAGAVPEVFGTAQADVPGGAGEGGGEGRSPLAGAPARGARLAQDGRGGITTAQTQAEYLEGQAVAHKSATIETFKGDTGTDVVVASDAAWEAMFGPGSVESQKAKALNGKIYLPQVSTTWSEQTLRSALTHEGSHVMRQTGYKPYMELLGDVGGYVDFESEATNSLMNGLLAHTGVTMEQFMDDPKAQARVYDELCATISGHTAIGEFEGEFDGKATKLSDFFRSEWEFNEFLGRLQQIQETFHHQNKVQDHGGQQAIGGGPASVGAAERGFTTPGTTPTERTSRLAEGVLHSTSSRREAAGGLMSPPT